MAHVEDEALAPAGAARLEAHRAVAPLGSAERKLRCGGSRIVLANHAAIDALDTNASVCYDHTDLTVVGGLLGFIKSTM